jgi:MFS family permease
VVTDNVRDELAEPYGSHGLQAAAGTTRGEQRAEMIDELPRRFGQFEALVVTALVWFLCKFLRYVFPPLFETLGESYDVSQTVLGTAFTGFMLVYATMQFPSGWIADRLGSVRVLTVGSLCMAVGALTVVVDSPFPVLAAAMVLIGAGTGTVKTVAVRLLSRAYPARTGLTLGVFETFGTFGGVAAPAAVVLVAGLSPVFGASWRTLFFAGGIASLGLAVAFTIRTPRGLSTASSSTDTPNADANAGDVPFGMYLTLFGEWQFILFVAVTVLVSFAFNGVVAFLPLYLTSEASLSSPIANLLYSVLFAVSLIQLVTGEVSDRVGTVPVLALTVGATTAGLVAVLALSATGGPLVLGAAVITFGVGAHGYRPVRSTHLASVIPDVVTGGGLGVVRTLMMVAGAVGPAAVGYLSEVGSFRMAFESLVAALVVALALTLLLWVLDR